MISYFYIFNIERNGFLHVDGSHNVFEWHDEIIILRDYFSTIANYYSTVSSAKVTCKFLCEHEKVKKEELLILKSYNYVEFDFEFPDWIGLSDAF